MICRVMFAQIEAGQTRAIRITDATKAALAVLGTAYFEFGGAYYRPFYSGSSVIYEVVAKPT